MAVKAVVWMFTAATPDSRTH